MTRLRCGCVLRGAFKWLKRCEKHEAMYGKVKSRFEEEEDRTEKRCARCGVKYKPRGYGFHQAECFSEWVEVVDED